MERRLTGPARANGNTSARVIAIRSLQQFFARDFLAPGPICRTDAARPTPPGGMPASAGGRAATSITDVLTTFAPS
jgi:hypothetical protein